MYRNNALYFPYIQVPKNKWFVHALLYWDKVYTIVPTKMLHSPEGLGFFMQILGSEGLLQYATPDHFMYEIDDFETGFIELVETSQIESVKNLDTTKTIRVHGEKLVLIGDYLKDRGLIRKVEGPGSWREVEYRTANLFLGYLAKRFSELPVIEAQPITDKEDYLRCFQTASKATPRMVRTPALHKLILDQIFPLPNFNRFNNDKAVKDFIDKLLIFKKDNQKDLTKFRTWLQEIIFEIALMEHEQDRNDFLEGKINQIKNDTQEIIAAMKEFGWAVSLSKLAGLISIVDPTSISGRLKSGLENLGIPEVENVYAVYPAKYVRAFKAWIN